MPRNSLPRTDSRFFSYSLCAAALLGAVGVSLGALAAHLPDHVFRVPNGREMLHSAVDILMWHAIALCALSLGHDRLSPSLSRWAIMAMFAGLLIFCLSVSLLALTDLTVFSISIGRVAPYGGTLLIVSWLLTAASALRR